jgi:hypothetical protein
MKEQAQQEHPDDLFLITREELEGCCNQMSISGYKVSANYVEAMVLSRPHNSTQNLHTCSHKEIRNGVEFCHYYDSPTDPATIRNQMLDDFAQWIKTEWVQESIKDYKESFNVMVDHEK